MLFSGRSSNCSKSCVSFQIPFFFGVDHRPITVGASDDCHTPTQLSKITLSLTFENLNGHKVQVKIPTIIKYKDYSDIEPRWSVAFVH